MKKKKLIPKTAKFSAGQKAMKKINKAQDEFDRILNEVGDKYVNNLFVFCYF